MDDLVQKVIDQIKQATKFQQQPLADALTLFLQAIQMGEPIDAREAAAVLATGGVDSKMRLDLAEFVSAQDDVQLGRLVSEVEAEFKTAA